jgi:hypothetical protein
MNPNEDLPIPFDFWNGEFNFMTFIPPFDFSPFEENVQTRESQIYKQKSKSQFNIHSNSDHQSHQAILQSFNNQESLISLIWNKFY